MKRNCPICNSEDLVFDVPIVESQKSTPLEIKCNDLELRFALKVQKSAMTYKQYSAPLKGNFCADCGYVMFNIDTDLAKKLRGAKKELDETNQEL